MLIKIVVMATQKVPPGTIPAEEEIVLSEEVSAKDNGAAIVKLVAENAEAILKIKDTHTFRVLSQKEYGSMTAWT